MEGQVEEPPTLVPPPAMARFASPDLRYLSLVEYIGNGGIRDKVLLCMKDRIFLTSVDGSLCHECKAGGVIEVTRQMNPMGTRETLVLALNGEEGKNFIVLRFPGKATLTENFLNVVRYYRKQPLAVKVEGRKKEDIGKSVGKIAPSAVGSLFKKPSSERKKLVREMSIAAPIPVIFNAGKDPHTTAYRSRITKIYDTYQPEKRRTHGQVIEEALISFKGQEEDLIAALVQRYGPEPQDPSSPDVGNGDTPARARLRAYFLDVSDDECAQILANWRGRESQMFPALAKKDHIPGPSSPSGRSAAPSTGSAVSAANLHSDPETIAPFSEENTAALAKKYHISGPSSTPGRGDLIPPYDTEVHTPTKQVVAPSTESVHAHSTRGAALQGASSEKEEKLPGFSNSGVLPSRGDDPNARRSADTAPTPQSGPGSGMPSTSPHHSPRVRTTQEEQEMAATQRELRALLLSLEHTGLAPFDPVQREQATDP